MSITVKVKNTMGVDNTWVGQTIQAGVYFTIPESLLIAWKSDSEVFASIGSGELLVNDGSSDFTDPVEGWNWLEGDTLPKSEIGPKVWVHESGKPVMPGKQFVVCWTSNGDDITNHVIGGGQKFEIDNEIGASTKSIDIEFDPEFGFVYMHEAYISTSLAGVNDRLSGEVWAKPTPLQTASNLDYELDGDKVKVTSGGPGKGTHGFNGTPILVPNHNKVGYWNYDGTNLTYSSAKTGAYDIYNVEKLVHRFVDKMYARLCDGVPLVFESEDSIKMPGGYLLRVTAYNNSDTAWYLFGALECYREFTVPKLT